MSKSFKWADDYDEERKDTIKKIKGNRKAKLKLRELEETEE